ncbi:hypothetical protein JTE90_013094 [Oedothorax gibbosus]|uniref:Annexin n=1 Tax=Oedothorax gibbosus TaxID=931172 RepID=A0AAV6UM45_9ARAC|nr:hypothetical protein JTE90_013094 [Oedothorax gibbosus]
MNNWNPYAPDHNPPPGIPKGYPYALNPNPPNANPMGSPGFPMQNYPPGNPHYGHNTPSDPAGNGSPYPNMSFRNSAGSPYPPSSSLYPAESSPYPAGSSSYPAGSSPYPAGSSPYPAGSSPYPAGSSPYPSGSSPYPAVSPYPAGSSPYPGPRSSPYPGVSPNSSESPYPPAGSSPYPAVSPNPSGSLYPAGSSPYPAGSSPYPAVSPNSSGSSYPPGSHPSQSYPTSRQLPNMANYLGEGTVKSYPNFDPRIDAEALRKAMKGFGTDEKAIISVLANRDNAQRVYIGVAFKQLYGKDLIDDLKSELSGNFEQVILALMLPTHDYLATELHKAISGIGTDEDVLIEVLCSRTNQEIWAINEAYTRLFGKSLESDIKGDTSGHLQRLLVSTCTGCRSEEPADSIRAKQTAEALYQAGAAQWGTDESVFNSILVAESLQQLAHTFYEYQKLTGKTVAQAIEGEMSGDLKKGMLTIAKCVENRPSFFAEKLYKAMKVGLGTDDNTLIRIVVSRCEIDMVQIKAEYERNYGKPLADAISGDTSAKNKCSSCCQNLNCFYLNSYSTSRELLNMANYIGEGTVTAYPDFDPRVDAEALREAMKGFGTDEDAIISILANRDNAQRVYIGVAFKQLYGKDLIDDLKSELKGNLEQVILALMMPTSDFLATELHNAISGIGTDENVLIEVLCSRTNQEIWAINEAYTRLFENSLESDIEGDTSGHFQRLLISTVTGCRSEDPADSTRAKETAQTLFEAGAAQWGTDESVFNSILVAESLQQLAHTFYEYQKLTENTVAQAIESEMSGDLKDGALAIAKCVENRPLFFAEKLYNAMKGIGTDENTLIRIVVSRCEIDMVQIKAEYERNYGEPLADAIAGDSSGDYRKVLLALVK